MSTIDAFHLPGLDPGDYDGWHAFPAGAGNTVRAPRLTSAGMRRITARLLPAAQRLRRHPVDRVITAIDTVAGRLRTEHDPLRVTALATLPPLTGYSAAMIQLIVDRMAEDWGRPQLERVLRAELEPAGGEKLEPQDPAIQGTPAEGIGSIVERGGQRWVAVAPRVVAHVFAGNVPGVAVTSLVRALLLRAASIGKTAAGEPLLAALFARALAETDPVIGDALAVSYWPGGDEELERIAWASADVIVAYGGARTLDAVRSRAPASTPVLDHGPRLSLGFVAAEALPSADACRALADDVARAVATFDQQGCVSPHAIFVEDGPLGVDALARDLVDALARIEQVLPRGSLTDDEAAAIRAVRSHAEFGQIAGRDITLVSPPDAPFTVVLHGTPDFEPSCLQRTVHVHRTPSIAHALTALQPYRGVLQSAALAGDNSAHAGAIAAAGFTRISTFSRLPWPDPASPHDGRGPLRELLRLVAIELD